MKGPGIETGLLLCVILVLPLVRTSTAFAGLRESVGGAPLSFFALNPPPVRAARGPFVAERFGKEYASYRERIRCWL
jgi:hypothetical protein